MLWQESEIEKDEDNKSFLYTRYAENEAKGFSSALFKRVGELDWESGKERES